MSLRGEGGGTAYDIPASEGSRFGKIDKKKREMIEGTKQQAAGAQSEEARRADEAQEKFDREAREEFAREAEKIRQETEQLLSYLQTAEAELNRKARDYDRTTERTGSLRETYQQATDSLGLFKRTAEFRADGETKRMNKKQLESSLIEMDAEAIQDFKALFELAQRVQENLRDVKIQLTRLNNRKEELGEKISYSVRDYGAKRSVDTGKVDTTIKRCEIQLEAFSSKVEKIIAELRGQAEFTPPTPNAPKGEVASVNRKPLEKLL